MTLKMKMKWGLSSTSVRLGDSDLSRQSPVCTRCRPSLWCPPSAPNTSCESLWIHTGGSESPQTNWNKQQQHDGVKREVRESCVCCATQGYWELRANANVHFQVKVLFFCFEKSSADSTSMQHNQISSFCSLSKPDTYITHNSTLLWQMGGWLVCC